MPLYSHRLEDQKKALVDAEGIAMVVQQMRSRGSLPIDYLALTLDQLVDPIRGEGIDGRVVFFDEFGLSHET